MMWYAGITLNKVMEDDNMKVVVSGYVGKKITGIGRNLISLLNTTNNRNQYIVYTNEDMKQDFQFSNPNVKVKTYSVSKNNSLKNLLWTTFVFPFIVFKEKADIALIPNFTLLLFKFKPTVVIMHDLIEFNVPNKFSKMKMFYRTKVADPITAKVANMIITVSENSKRDIMKFLNVREEKITVIYNGVDQTKFKKININNANKILEDKNWPKNFILYAGTIDHPGKNAMAVIKVFERIKEAKQYDGELILAGMPGAGYEYIENYLKSTPYKNEITLTGYVTDEELITLYSTCKVFCFVSLYEGFGIPPLEALACGAKVVVSNTSSIPEVVGDIGWTANPSDLDEIYVEIVKALSSSIDDEYIKKVDRHLLNYSWKTLSTKFEAVLSKLEKC